MEFNAGDCFVFNPARVDPHLNIVLCGPSEDSRTIIAVMVNTAHDGTDGKIDNRQHNFILQPKAHPFVHRLSVVNYKSAKEFNLAALQMLEKEAASDTGPYNERQFLAHQTMNPELFQQVLEMALTSKATQKGIKAEIRKRLGISLQQDDPGVG